MMTTINNNDKSDEVFDFTQYAERISLCSEDFSSPDPCPLNRITGLKNYFNQWKKVLKHKKQKREIKENDEFEVMDLNPKNKKGRKSKTYVEPMSPQRDYKDKLQANGRPSIFATPQVGIMDFLMKADTKDFISNVLNEVKLSKDELIGHVPDKTQFVDFTQKLGRLQNSLDKIQDINLKQEIREVLDKVSENSKDVIDYGSKRTMSVATNLALLAAFCGSVIFYYRNRTKESIALVGVSFAALLIMGDVFSSKTFLMRIVETLSKLKVVSEDDDETASPQLSDGDVEDGVTGIAGLLAAYVSCTTGKSVPTELFKNLSVLSRCKSSITDIIKVVFKMIERAINWLRVECLDMSSLRLLADKNAKVEEFLVECDKIKNEHRLGNLTATEYPTQRVKALILFGRSLVKDIPRDRHSEGSLRIVFEELRNLEKICALLVNIRAEQRGTRMEPVGVLLKGGPGTGKSVIMQHIYTAFLANILPPEDYEDFTRLPSDFVHNRQFETKYFDGFGPRIQVMMFDDFGQARDMPGNPDNEYMNIIRAINGFEYVLHMAHLENKGSTVFNGKLVLASTNLENFMCTSLNEVEALTRRFALQIVVCPKEEYCVDETKPLGPMKRRFDKNKLPLNVVNDLDATYHPDMKQAISLTPDCMDFHLMSANGKGSIGILSFDQVMEKIMKLYERNLIWFKGQKTEFEETQQRYRAASGIDEIYAERNLRNDLNNMDNDVEMEELQQEMENFYDVANPQVGSELPGALHLPFPDPAPSIASDYFEPDTFQKALDDLTDELPEAEDLFHQPEAIDVNLSYFEPKVREISKMIVLDMDERIARDDWGYTDVIECIYRLTFSLYGKDTRKFGVSRNIAMLVKDLKKTFTRHYQTNTLDRLNEVIRQRDYTMEWIMPEQTILEGVTKKGTAIADYSKTFLSTCKEYYREFYEFMVYFVSSKKHMNYLKGILTGGAIGLLIRYVACPLWKGLKQTFGNLFGSKVEPESQGWSDKLTHKDIKTNMTPAQARALASSGAKPQMGKDIDQCGAELVRKIVKTNVYELSYQLDNSKDEYTSFGFCMFVKAHIALLPWHFIKKLIFETQKDPTVLENRIKLTKSNPKNPDCHIHLMTVADMIKNVYSDQLIKRDLCLVGLTKDLVQPHVDRIKNFATDQDVLHINRRNIPFMMPLPRMDGETYIGKASMYDSPVPVSSPYTGDYTISEAFCYDGFTGNGDCGALFCVLNQAIPVRKIYGMHVAGHSSRGQAYSAVVTQEDLEHELKQMPKDFTDAFSAEDFDDLVIAPADPQIGNDLSENQFNVFGKLKLAPMRNTMSSIVRSDLYNVINPCLTAPALLYTKGDIDPLSIALSKYGRNNIKHFTEERVKKALNSAALNYQTYLFDQSDPPNDVRVHTMDEAIFGMPSNPRVNGIPKDTSPGWPMNCSGVNNLKKHLWSDDIQLKHQAMSEVHILVKEAEHKLKNNVRPTFIYTDFLKDELRPKEKSEKGSSRLVSGGPMIMAILFKMYFGSFVEWFQRNMIVNGSAVGINPYSSEWHSMTKHLCTQSTHDEEGFGAGDFGKFDASQRRYIHNLILMIIEFYYEDSTEEESRIRRGLWFEITNAKHVADGLLYELWSGMSSGTALTSIINTMYNNISIRFCWFYIEIPGNFNLFVVFIGFGDDHLFSVARSKRKLFNEMVLAEVMDVIGLEYTTELKTLATVPLRKLKDCEFLKRGFRWAEELGLMLGPLRLDVILNIPQWTKKGSLKDAIVADNCVCSMRELSLHNEQVYNVWMKKISSGFDRYYPNHKTSKSLRTPYSVMQKEVINSTICFGTPDVASEVTHTVETLDELDL